MNHIQGLIDRYKHIRSVRQLKNANSHRYAFVGIGNHSTSNLYPVLDYLHVPLKYICCTSDDKLPLIEAAYHHVRATTSLSDILNDTEVKGVLVSASPKAHFSIASKVIESGKALFIEKPPCQSKKQLSQLIELRKSANFPPVVVGLQKRYAPAMRTLKKMLEKCGGEICYNFRYLTGAYPEGDALLDLFIHPLDCATHLFGMAEVKCVERIADHTLLIILKHARATGVLELSTAYTWTDAQEILTVNTKKGIYEMRQLESLTFQNKPHTIFGLPMEKICPSAPVTTELFHRNNFVPTTANNQIVTQGYFHTLKSFIDAVEGRKAHLIQDLESFTDTYTLLETIRQKTV